MLLSAQRIHEIHKSSNLRKFNIRILMNKATILKYLALLGKGAGLLAGLNAIPFIKPELGIVIFASASILKDVVNRVGDLLDDGQSNGSFKAD